MLPPDHMAVDFMATASFALELLPLSLMSWAMRWDVRVESSPIISSRSLMAMSCASSRMPLAADMAKGCSVCIISYKS